MFEGIEILRGEGDIKWETAAEKALRKLTVWTSICQSLISVTFFLELDLEG